MVSSSSNFASGEPSEPTQPAACDGTGVVAPHASVRRVTRQRPAMHGDALDRRAECAVAHDDATTWDACLV
jgi:hypothetical protein